MTVMDVDKDVETLTMTVAAEYDVSAERAWQLWADPRQLERWWGPPTYPATVEEHDLTPGGRVTYYMTGPDGNRFGGWWEVLEAGPPRDLVLKDGFADAEGSPNVTMPTTIMRVRIDDRDGGGVRMTLVSTFPSLEALEQLLGMGMQEGLLAAMGQIDAILTG
jgi:uncharacterized protein YndB with AHSA1/START domain